MQYVGLQRVVKCNKQSLTPTPYPQLPVVKPTLNDKAQVTKY